MGFCFGILKVGHRLHPRGSAVPEGICLSVQVALGVSARQGFTPGP